MFRFEQSQNQTADSLLLFLALINCAPQAFFVPPSLRCPTRPTTLSHPIPVMSNPAWRPVSEDEANLFSKCSWLQGATLTGVAYGAQATLFMLAFCLLYEQGRKTKNWMRSAPFMVYIFIIFLMGTLFMASCVEMTQLSFINQHNIPGGLQCMKLSNLPSLWMNQAMSPLALPTGLQMPLLCIISLAHPYNISDRFYPLCLQVWCYYVILKGCSIPMWSVMFFLCLLYLGSFGRHRFQIQGLKNFL